MRKTILYLLVMVIAITMVTISCTSTGNSGNMEAEGYQNDETLIETNWILTKLYNPDNITVPDFSEIELVFRNKEEISGFGGSNIFFGEYTADENNIKIVMLGSTKMSTPFDAFETYYMSLFETLQTFSIDNDILYIYGEDKSNPIMTFLPDDSM